ncbi:MAG: type 4a pilus biogenesis protein PilO [Candidatus Margulisbacteria bacterium]|nr:type 4a pilus biogenesis protein PilO [Candidatus Margulisiibacteriota bacterium]
MSNKEKIIKLIALLVILVLAFMSYRALVAPKRQGISNLQRSLENVELQMSSILGEKVSLKTGSTGAAELEKELENLTLKIPSESDLPRIINQLLTQTGQGLGLDYTLVEPKSAQKEGRYNKIPIELQFITTFSKLNTYLTQLDKLPQQIIIENLLLRRLAEKPGALEVQLTLAVFVMPGEETEKEPAITDSKILKIPTANPFRPGGSRNTITTGNGQAQKPLKLQGIIRGNFSAAIINNQVVYVGDVINGYRVMNIRESSVVLIKNGKTLTLQEED